MSGKHANDQPVQLLEQQLSAPEFRYNKLLMVKEYNHEDFQTSHHITWVQDKLRHLKLAKPICHDKLLTWLQYRNHAPKTKQKSLSFGTLALYTWLGFLSNFYNHRLHFATKQHE